MMKQEQMKSKNESKRPGRKPLAEGVAMTRRDLALELRERLGSRNTHSEMIECVDALLDTIAEALIAGRHLEFRGFGTFSVVTRKSRVGRNPRQPDETYDIPKRKVVNFKPAAGLQQAVAAAKTVGERLSAQANPAKRPERSSSNVE